MFTGKHVLRRQKYTCTWTPSKSPRVVNNTVVDRDSLYRHWIEKSPPTAKYKSSGHYLPPTFNLLISWNGFWLTLTGSATYNGRLRKYTASFIFQSILF